MTITDMEAKYPKYEDFIDSFVGFIDLLGFNERVRGIQTSADFDEVGKLLYTIKVTADNFNKSNGLFNNYNFTAISDSIIVSVPLKERYSLTGLLTILHNIQYELLATSFKTLVRGYVKKGPIYHKNGYIFGSGYSDAYKGEIIIGHAPRIVLDNDIIKEAKRVIGNVPGDTYLDFVQQDKCDGFYFIDYLKPIGVQSGLPMKKLIAERMVLKEFIEDNLSKFDTDYHILPKYKWLENYFNSSSEYFAEGAHNIG